MSEGPWTEAPECPLSSCMRYVLTDHGWCEVARREPSPSSSSGQMCWCGHGQRHRVRVRRPGDGNPHQD